MIDLSKLPAPKVVETLDAEVILAQMRDDLIARAPELESVLDLESELAVKILEVCAYREVLIRARVNDAGRAVMLAFSTGADLDNLGALLGVSRQSAGDILEIDNDFRTRIQLALEGFSTAGPVGAYVFWGLSADPDVKDVAVTSPAPGQVEITVLSRIADGSPTEELIAVVATKLGADDVRPLTDEVLVRGATITAYTVEAELMLYGGPDSDVVMAAAETAVETYVENRHRLGHDVTVSGLHAALHQAGVQNVTLTAPTSDIVIAPGAAAHCTSIAIAFGGRDV